MLDEKERAAKALKLNGFDSIVPSLYSIGNEIKPTLRIRRIKPQQNNPTKYLNGASQIQDKLNRERERAEKALKLNSLFS